MNKQISSNEVNKKENFFFYFLCLTGFFILLEISFFIQCNRIYLNEFSFVTDHLMLPASILPGIIYFLLAQCLVHLAYCYFAWLVSYLIIKLLRLKGNTALFFSISVWTIGIATVCIANQYYLPNSKFNELTALILINQKTTDAALIFVLTLDAILLLLALVSLIKLMVNSLFILIRHYSGRVISILMLGLLLAGGVFYFFPWKSQTPYLNGATSLRPNIIIIGVDSLRPDFLGFFGREINTPFFDSFLEQATVFSEAVTPLARTFPSWVSLLSGEYPRQTGIRTNLASQANNYPQTLPAILRQQGYDTIFATDETRFSNIDKNMGFNQLISPPIGLNDFLIGTFNDFPLSNLLMNTILGKWLFPYNYANRPVYFTYDPDSFLNLLYPQLAKPKNQPTFLAIHFCLTHYPYLWRNLDGVEETNVVSRYEKSIERVDKQIDDLFVWLKKYHWLDHAIVILLSDHGEALELPGDRITEKDLFVTSKHTATTIPQFYPPNLEGEVLDSSAGHGTDVLGLPQYHSLLAFKLYGAASGKGIVSGIVSLLDIKPTVLQLLQLPFKTNVGTSLATIIKQGSGSHSTFFSHSPIFLESDFSPEAIRTVYPETNKVLLDGIKIFRIDPISSRLIVKDEMEEMIIHSKQYAVITNDWMLALYPQDNHFYMPILVNLLNGKWTNDLQSSFAKHSPAASLLNSLKDFYGEEIKAVK